MLEFLENLIKTLLNKSLIDDRFRFIVKKPFSDNLAYLLYIERNTNQTLILELEIMNLIYKQKYVKIKRITRKKETIKFIFYSENELYCIIFCFKNWFNNEYLSPYSFNGNLSEFLGNFKL